MLILDDYKDADAMDEEKMITMSIIQILMTAVLLDMLTLCLKGLTSSFPFFFQQWEILIIATSLQRVPLNP